MMMTITKLRQLIRETVELALDDEQFGPENRPDQSVSDFEGFRGYVADRLVDVGAHSGLADTVRTCDVGHPTHDILWNTWGFVEPECSTDVGIPYAEMGQVLWPYADGMVRDMCSVATEIGPDIIDADDVSDRFCASLESGEMVDEPEGLYVGDEKLDDIEAEPELEPEHDFVEDFDDEEDLYEDASTDDGGMQVPLNRTLKGTSVNDYTCPECGADNGETGSLGAKNRYLCPTCDQ